MGICPSKNYYTLSERTNVFFHNPFKSKACTVFKKEHGANKKILLRNLNTQKNNLKILPINVVQQNINFQRYSQHA